MNRAGYPQKSPKLQCIKKTFIEPLTFSEWIAKDENVYISTNLKKYSKDPTKKDDWGVAWLEIKLFLKEITIDEYLQEYENHIRRHKWKNLELLIGKTMGCWCENPNNCHGKILQKLFKERLLEKRMIEKDEMEDYVGFDSNNYI